MCSPVAVPPPPDRFTARTRGAPRRHLRSRRLRGPAAHLLGTAVADLAARCHGTALEGRRAVTVRLFAAPQTPAQEAELRRAQIGRVGECSEKRRPRRGGEIGDLAADRLRPALGLGAGGFESRCVVDGLVTGGFQGRCVVDGLVTGGFQGRCVLDGLVTGGFQGRCVVDGLVAGGFQRRCVVDVLVAGGGKRVGPSVRVRSSGLRLLDAADPMPRFASSKTFTGTESFSSASASSFRA